MPEFRTLHAQQRRIRFVLMIKITACVMVPAKIKVSRQHEVCATRPLPRQEACCPIRIAESGDLEKRGLSRIAPQQPQRCDLAIPGEPFQCVVRIDRLLRHRPADSFACEQNVCSIQCNEQVFHASGLQPSGLVSWHVGSCTRVLCQERGLVPRYLVSSHASSCVQRRSHETRRPRVVRLLTCNHLSTSFF